MTPSEIILEELEAIRNDLRARYDQLGMRATGNFDRELEVVEQTVKKYTINATPYSRQLILGRRPGTMPPVAAIEAWMKAKGIRAVEARMTDRQLAFAIARSIKNRGTRYWRQGGTDLLDSVITPERMQRIIDRISDYHILDLTTKIKRILTT